MDLSAQEVNLFVPHIYAVPNVHLSPSATQLPDRLMDLWTVVAIVMLAVWGALTFLTEAPGVVHLLLTFGVFIIIWRIVVRGTPAGPKNP